MVANVNKIATVGEAPWWVGSAEDRGQWTDLGENPVRAEEMFEAWGCNWLVKACEMRAVEFPGDPGLPVPHMRAVVREDTKDVLGTVSDRFELIQNSRAMSFFDEVVGEGQAVYHSAGALGRGEKIWILAKLPAEILVAGNDKVESFMLLANAHDGSMSFRMHFTPIRVVCQNTFNIAVAGGVRESRAYRQAHFKGIGSRLNSVDARGALGMAGEHLAAFAEQANRLAQTPLEMEQLEAFLQRIFPIPAKLLLGPPPEEPLLLLPEPRAEDYVPTADFSFRPIGQKRELVRQLFSGGKGNKGETRWDAVNAVAEFTDYLDGWDSKRANSLLFGAGAALKQQAWNLLTHDFELEGGNYGN